MKKIKKIFIVPYCHADWAWTHTRNWHEKRYNLVFNEVLTLFKKHPEFRWYLDNYICELEPFLRYSKNRIPELRRRIKEGKIAICGGFANIRPNMVGEETFIRNLILGRKKFQELFPSKIDLSVHADIVDVSLGHLNMPQVLSLAGYNYFRFWRPEVALNLKKIPKEFIWEGLDGTKILVSRGCYGGLIGKDIEKSVKEELEYNACLSPTGLIWLSQGSDDARPLRTGAGDYLNFFSFVKDRNKKKRGPMLFATPIEFFKELRKENLPLIKSTIDPCDVCYNAAFAGARGLWKLRIETDKELTEAEMWSAVAGKSEVSFQKLWENLLIFSAHATQWLFQEDFDEIYQLALKTKWEAEEIKKNALKTISQRIDLPVATEATIFNQLPFRRKALAKILLSFPSSSIRGMHSLKGSDAPGDRWGCKFSLKDGEGKIVPFQIINEMGSKGWEVELLAKINLPSLGYNTLTMKKKNEPMVIPAAKSPKNILENDKIRISFQKGKIIAIKDKSLGMEYKGKKKDLITLKAFDGATIGRLHVGKTIKEHRVDWQRAEVKEVGPLRWSYLREGKISFHPVKQKINLYPGEARIEFETEIFWQGADSLLTFTTILPFSGNLNADTPFAVEPKNLSEEPYGKAAGSGENIERMRPGAFFAKSFVDWSDGKKGIAYINYDGDRYYVYNENDRILNHILINGILTLDGDWEKDINRERKALGCHSFKSSIVFHPGDWKRAKIYQQALSLRNRPEIFYPEQKKSRSDLPPAHSFLSLKPENLILTAFYQKEKFYILRFFETEGKKTEARIKLPFKPKKVKPIDFLGQEMKEPEVKIEKNSLYFLVKPYKIITLGVAKE